MGCSLNARNSRLRTPANDGCRARSFVLDPTPGSDRKEPYLADKLSYDIWTGSDIAFAGLGENGHLAFNGPPADFEMEDPYLIVTLDEACRKQQIGEGWFAILADVPQQAISKSIKILKSRQLSDARNSKAIKACFDGDVTPLAPASILQRHPDTTTYNESAALLSPAAVGAHKG